MNKGFIRNIVTGGAGFLGSHLIDRLMQNGEEVICLDNFFTGHKSNIIHLFDNPKFEFIRHDITEPILLEADRIWHLACPASPIHYQFNPIKTSKTSFLGSLNMLGLAKRLNARIFLASTSEIYGDPLEHPQKESYRGNVNHIGPRSCYDEGKRISETLFFDYKRIHNTDIRVTRIFNTYGPRMLPNDGRVVSNFINQALRGRDLTIYGDGSQTRSFCYVSDLIDGFIKLMDSNLSGPVNLGNPNEMPIIELAKKIINKVNPELKLVFKEVPEDDPSRRKPDISLASKNLDWNAKIQIDDGLDKTIKFFKNTF
mgnify:CR=1 FL=1|tara:strand:+ start:129 stop:1067 length:939 start_codon:yes stop_codon:yes gene_type:complete